MRCSKAHNTNLKLPLTKILESGAKLENRINETPICSMWLGCEIAELLKEVTLVHHPGSSTAMARYNFLRNVFADNKRECFFFSPADTKEHFWDPMAKRIGFYRNLHDFLLGMKIFGSELNVVLCKGFGVNLSKNRVKLSQESDVIPLAVLTFRGAENYGASTPPVTGLALDTHKQNDVLDASDNSCKGIGEFIRAAAAPPPTLILPHCSVKTSAIDFQKYCERADALRGEKDASEWISSIVAKPVQLAASLIWRILVHSGHEINCQIT